MVKEDDNDVAGIETNAINLFSLALVAQAKNRSYEDNEIAQLVLLICKEQNLETDKLIEFLRDCDIFSPVVLACLKDEGLKIPASSIIDAINNQVYDVSGFIGFVSGCLEQGIFSTGNKENIIALHEIGKAKLNTMQYREFTRVICDHTKTKKQCGKVLCVFTSHMSGAEASTFIYGNINFGFFSDLRGSMKSFLAEIPGECIIFHSSLLYFCYLRVFLICIVEVAELVQSIVAESNLMDENGKKINSTRIPV